jgi:hypothetical protein
MELLFFFTRLGLKISGTLTLNELSKFLKEIYDKNDGKFAAFNRFADLYDLKVQART